MIQESLETRMTAVETELNRVKQQLAAEQPLPAVPWWEKIYGTFADSEEYEEAMRLGREYRASQRPPDDEENARG